MPSVRGYTTPDAQQSAFETWKGQVNSAVVAICGLGCDYLPDFGYWDAWAEGRKPQSVAKDVVREAHFF